MIHFHGTPITPRRYLLELAGRCFCVSYAAPNDVDVCHEIGQSVMLDNGAFSFWRGNREPDWPGYYRWCDKWLERWTTWAVIPDVIDGTEAQNDALIAQWPFGTRGAPVWHVHEPLDRLARLAATWPLVCIGSSGIYATLGTFAWQLRMAAAMEVVCDGRGRPLTRLHMLRGMDYADGAYPFYSADSTNIAQNHNQGLRGRQDVRALADRLDGRQPAARWHSPGEQITLEEAG